MDINKFFKFGTKTMKYCDNSAECCLFGCCHIIFALVVAVILCAGGHCTPFSILISAVCFPLSIVASHRLALYMFCRQEALNRQEERKRKREERLAESARFYKSTVGRAYLALLLVVIFGLCRAILYKNYSAGSLPPSVHRFIEQALSLF